MSFSSNSVRIELDAGQNDTFTSLDIIKGRVCFSIPSEETISSIQVKLEGISRTVLVVPKNNEVKKRQKDKNATKNSIEMHRVLYQVSTVFPPKDIRNVNTSQKYTLKSGNYEYPFQFRIPVNSSCSNSSGSSYQPSGGMFESFSFTNGSLGYVRDAKNHINTSLPPSFSGLGELASVRYFLKVTVRRSSMLKINFRNYQPFIFLPIDPPVDNSGKVAFVRREKSIAYKGSRNNNSNRIDANRNNNGDSGGLFKSFFKSKPSATSNSIPLRSNVQFLFEVRYPLGIGLVPLEVLPLGLFVSFKKQPQSNDIIYLRELNFTLFATTIAASHQYSERSVVSLNFFNRTQLNIPLNMKAAAPTPVDPTTHLPTWELPINPSVYHDAILPNTVAPSFKTCNIAQVYTLQITGKFSMENGPLEEVSLSTDVQIWSGIRPSEGLLRAALPARPNMNTADMATAGFSKPGAIGSEKPPPKPVRPSNGKNANGMSNEGSALPTYDEAITNSLGPIEGPRRTYQQSDNYYTNLDSFEDGRD
ncbi:hypothetical protein NADFUDRAFT_82235 [Nadsonia fulvescens var. elongata DSM 6958]|uniref:Arrestin-like N-terminal domain-containing protein n=1 Tax=Nadsonia fulvescens var. elongata DSM 6958 TaxID=857566 RepID=A0A1E3PLU7_9ASCO|nr:hypothetical protein NADFUDRAFT_82235 [Nadsonia fulvescens var. elongata DSM 6958]